MTIQSNYRPEFVLAGVVMKQLIAGAETAGAFCLFENSSDGASRTPIHVHDRDDETLYMLEGELQAATASETKNLGPGETIFLKRGIAHQLANVSGKPNRYILLCTPSGFEDFLAQAGRLRQSGEGPPGPPDADDIARLKEAAPRFGITLLQEWPEVAR